MAKKIQASQNNRIWEQFREHPYYKLCLSVFGVFQETCPTVAMTPEQLFVDAACTLDNILQPNGMSEEICKRLWTNMLQEYAGRDKTAYGQTETKCQVAMLFYCLMYAFQAINEAEYRCTLSNILHETIWYFYGKDSHPNGCLSIERKLKPEVICHAEALFSWIDDYRKCNENLTKLIGVAIGGKKKEGKSKKEQGGLTEYYPTINYKCDDQTRDKRIDIVQKLMVSWKMIENPENVDDFYALFNGSIDYRLNLTWSSETNTAVLHFLLQRLFKQPFIEELTHGKPKAVARNILRGKNPSGDITRLNNIHDTMISILIYALDPTKPLLKLRRDTDRLADQLKGFDIEFLAEQLAKEGYLSITKDLNKQ